MNDFARPRHLVLLLALLAAGPAWAQPGNFDSTSDGSDGALTFADNAGIITFDPANFSPALDSDGDGVYHFTTITIPLGTTVHLAASQLGQGRPVVWLASGAVTIAGTLDLNGGQGHAAGGPYLPSVAGAGGYSGGRAVSTGFPARSGNGPGGGSALLSLHGAGAGHATAGGPGTQGSAGQGRTYGNTFLVPLTGGSGGGGANATPGNNTGGGAGGGALLLASSAGITVDGVIRANGGRPGGIISSQTIQGGAGSGGGIRLIAPVLRGNGQLRAEGGQGNRNNSGGLGRIRIEAFQYFGPTDVRPTASIATPGSVLAPPSAPLVRVTAIGGVAVTPDPTGSFVTPDVVIDAPGPVSISLAATNIPVGTVITLRLQPEATNPVTVQSTPLSGSQAASTASATATLPSGFTRLFVTASWTP